MTNWYYELNLVCMKIAQYFSLGNQYLYRLVSCFFVSENPGDVFKMMLFN